MAGDKQKADGKAMTRAAWDELVASVINENEDGDYDAILWADRVIKSAVLHRKRHYEQQHYHCNCETCAALEGK